MSKKTEIEVWKEIIITLLSMGSTPDQIGAGIGLSGRTVEKWIVDYRKQCGAKNITHLVAINLRKKFIK